ncbi:hypothetical protein CLV65_0550 [Pseudoscardovia suis]|uniref:Uncharacterized protein n=1 Tax=Pseudoscardovia suis TaxID=987063 RepID=A0A261ES88_9BIFI|nr:hypothetical protein PSSU_1537 [Pseudoscardovia suis]PJJ69832.1 hypothetical protein CLV65_0550 [Pseudoscardovia suis]
MTQLFYTPNLLTSFIGDKSAGRRRRRLQTQKQHPKPPSSANPQTVAEDGS